MTITEIISKIKPFVLRWIESAALTSLPDHGHTGPGDGGLCTDLDAIHDDVSGEIHAITEKTSPASTDEIIIEDSAASYAKKRVQIGNLPGGGGGTTDVLMVQVFS